MLTLPSSSSYHHPDDAPPYFPTTGETEPTTTDTDPVRQHLMKEYIDEYNQIVDRIGREQRLYVGFVNSLYYYSLEHLLAMTLRHPRYTHPGESTPAYEKQDLIELLSKWDHDTYPFQELRERAAYLHQEVKLLDDRYH